MLHQKVMLIKTPGYTFIFIALVLIACRNDHPLASNDEVTSYLGDYDAPSAKWTFLTRKGELLGKAIYDDVGPFSEGLAAVNLNGLWGYINASGKIIIEPVYKSAWAFHEGRARVRPFNQQDVFITTAGVPIQAEEWSAADDFSSYRARVKVGNAYGYIDTSGHLVEFQE